MASDRGAECLAGRAQRQRFVATDGGYLLASREHSTVPNMARGQRQWIFEIAAQHVGQKLGGVASQRHVRRSLVGSGCGFITPVAQLI